MAHSELFERQTALVKMNLGWLGQALELLETIDDKTYRKAPRTLAAHRVAAHLRHVIEFYECFLDGLDMSHVDYDARRRDSTLESSRPVATARIRTLIERLELDPTLRGDGVLFVRMEDATALAVREPYLMSSVGRELQALSSHTVHHFALIAMVLSAHGHRVAAGFGMAPSTLRHQNEGQVCPGISGGGLMCTVSWLADEEGFQLLCNRDEKRTRGLATAPTAEWIDGVQVLLPRDEASGGTWITVNEYGVAVTLLNGANLSGRENAGDYRHSLGLVVQQLASARTASEVCERAWRLDLSSVAPFTVAALEPGMPAAIVEWNGAEKGIVAWGEPFLPLASSSFDAEGARRARRQAFARTCGTSPRIEELLAFHQQHEGGAAPIGNAYSPCMHRPDAETVSFSRIQVTRNSAKFLYQPNAPCRHTPPISADLALRLGTI